jgi:hypothetical protein
MLAFGQRVEHKDSQSFITEVEAFPSRVRVYVGRAVWRLSNRLPWYTTMARMRIKLGLYGRTDVAIALAVLSRCFTY